MRAGLEKVEKFLDGEPRVFDDSEQQSAFDVFAVARDGHDDAWVVRMLEVVVRAGDAGAPETGTFERPRNLSIGQCWKALGRHALER